MAKNGGQLAAAVELVKRASKGSGSSMPQPAAVRITFVPKKAPAGRRVSFRTGKGYAVRFDAPRLESFVHLDIKPSNVLIGAGLQVTEDIPASAIVEAGLPAMLVRDFALASGMTMADIGSVVGTSERTMSRKVGSGESLEPAESDRAYRLFDAVARAGVEVLGFVFQSRAEALDQGGERVRQALERSGETLGGFGDAWCYWIEVAFLAEMVGGRSGLACEDLGAKLGEESFAGVLS